MRSFFTFVATFTCAIICSLLIPAATEEPGASENPSQASPSATAQAEDKIEAQTSPKGSFKVETVFTKAEDPAENYEQQYVVSTADPKIREPLGEKRQDQPATYFISPDEQWIFAQVYYGSGMGGARVYQRKKDFQFERAMDEKSIWKFFEKQALAGRKRPSDWAVEIVDFIAWSPDSARLLFSLRTGKRVTGKGSLGYYDWHGYYNVRKRKFELTDELRALNRSAHKVRPED
jgi:hypothetical protein